VIPIGTSSITPPPAKCPRGPSASSLLELFRPGVQAGVLGDAGRSGDRVDFDAAGLVAAVGVGDAGQDEGELFWAEGWDGVAEVDDRSVRSAEADGCGDEQVGPFAVGQRADVAGDGYQVGPMPDVFSRLYPWVARSCEPGAEPADKQFDGGPAGVNTFQEKVASRCRSSTSSTRPAT